MSDPQVEPLLPSASAAVSLLLRRTIHALTVGRRQASLDRKCAHSLLDLGRRALDVTFNAGDVSALQAQAREDFRRADERLSEISRIEGAPVPEDPEERQAEERDRLCKTEGLRAGLAALVAQSDRRLSELGTRVLALDTTDPRLLKPIERLRALHAERRDLDRWTDQYRQEWRAKPVVARVAACTMLAGACALVLLVLWGIAFARGGGGATVRPRPLAAPLREPATPPAAAGAQSAPPSAASSAPASVAATVPVSAPLGGEGGGRGVRLAAEIARTRPASVKFSGFVKATGERYLHKLLVEPELPPVTISTKVHHLGETERKDWKAPAPEGPKIALTLELAHAPEGLSGLTIEGNWGGGMLGDTLRINGRTSIPLPSITAPGAEFAQARFRLDPTWLNAGSNTIAIEAGRNSGKLDEFEIRQVRWEPGSVLYRLSLSKVPGVDTRLRVFAAEAEKPGRQLLDLHEGVVSEQVYPNLLLSPGAYFLEVSGDGKNTDVPYLLVAERLHTAGPGDEQEPNDDPATATLLALDHAMEGYLATASDADFYTLTLDKDTYLSITLSGIPGVAASVWVKDSRGYGQILEVNTGGVGEPDEADLVKLAAGEYRLVVQARPDSPAKSNPHVPYQLAVRHAAAQAGFEEEPNNTPDQANALPLGKSMRGRLDPADDQDWFVFKVDEPSLVRISVSGMDGVAYQLWLENPYTALPLQRTGEDAIVTNWPVAKGEHRFGIAGKTSHPVDRRQTYRVRVDTLAQPDNGYSVRDNSFETATEMTPDDTFRSALYPWEDADFYRITFKERDVIYRIKPMRFSFNRLGIQVFDSKRTLLKTISGTALENWTPDPGQYYLKVYRLDGGNLQEDYAFRVQEERLYTAQEEREFNDTRETATPLPEDTLMHSVFSPMAGGARDEDWYKLDVKDSAGKVYGVDVTPGIKQLDVAMALEDPAGHAVFPVQNQHGPGEAEHIDNWGPTPGTYYLHAWCPVEFTRNAPYTVRWRETGHRSADTEFEPNDTVAQANDLRLDVVLQGRLSTPEDVDVFKVTGSKAAPQIMRLKLSGTDNLHHVSILQPDGTPISADATPHNGVAEFTGFVLAKGQSIDVMVKSVSYQYRAANADYSLVATEVGPWDDGHEAEPNFDLAHANSLVPDKDLTGEIFPEGDVDCFIWHVPAGENKYYTWTVIPPADLNMPVDISYSADGKTWDSLYSGSVDGRSKASLVIPNILPRAGSYLLTLRAYGWSQSPYTVRLKSQPTRNPLQDVEFNNSKEWAQPIEVGTPVQGTIDYCEDVDHFAVRAGGSKAYRLRLKTDAKSRLEARVFRHDGKDWTQIKTIDLDPGEEAAVERWVTGDHDHVIAVTGRYCDLPAYAIALEPSTATDAVDAEFNDRYEDALPLPDGKTITGLIDAKNDRDVYKLEVPEAQGKVFHLSFIAPAKGANNLSIGVWDEANKNGANVFTIPVPAGKTFDTDDLLLDKGTWFVSTDGDAPNGTYSMKVDALGPRAADRLYGPSNAHFHPHDYALDRPLTGTFLPWQIETVSGARFAITTAVALDARLDVGKGCTGWLVLSNAGGADIRTWNLSGEGRQERLYLPTLAPGTYCLDVHGKAKEDRAFKLTVQKGRPGFFFAATPDHSRLNVALRDWGGHIVRSTSIHDPNWAPTNLIDGNPQTNGWASTDRTFPQEIVIGFAGDRAASIDEVRINPKANDHLENWAKTVEVLASRSGGDNDWQSLGTLELGLEDHEEVLHFEALEAKQVMVRVKANRGGSISELGKVVVMEAVPGTESFLKRDYAVPLEFSTFAGGLNPLFTALGGKVESVSSEVNRDWAATNLLDGWPAGPGWLTANTTGPAEVVVSIAGNPVEIDRVIVAPQGSDGQNVVKDVQLWVSTQSKDSGFQKAAAFRIVPGYTWETYAFPPVKARYVKLRALSNYGGAQFYLGELMVIER